MSNDDQLMAMLKACNAKLLRMVIERQRKADNRERLLAAIGEPCQHEEPPCPT